MSKNFIWLLKLRFLSLFKINEIKNEKDKKRKSRHFEILIAWLIIVVVVCGYSAGYAYGLISMGCEAYIPTVVAMISSLLVMVFTLFRANSELFGFKDYDMLMSLPIKISTIIVSRICYLYLFAVGITMMVALPSGIMLFVFEQLSVVSVMFYLLGIFLIPIIPLVAVSIWAYLIAWIASKTRKPKALTVILYTVSIVGGIVFMNLLSYTGIEEINFEDTEAIMLLITDALRDLENSYVINKLYSSAVVTQSFIDFLIMAVVSIGVFVLFVAIVTPKYNKISSALKSHSGQKDYTMGALDVSGKLQALYKIELKRYFSCGIYWSNTIIGVIFALVLSGALLFADVETILGTIDGMPVIVNFDLIESLVPFAVAMMICMTCTTCSSVSLEGKNVWIKKTLPFSMADVIHAKLLVNLTLTIPTCVISSILIAIGLGYGFVQWVSAMLLLMVFAVFGAVIGLYLGFVFRDYGWETEAQVVKQGMASGLGMLVVPVVALVCAAPKFLLVNLNVSLYYIIIACIVLAVATVAYGRVRKQSL